MAVTPTTSRIQRLAYFWPGLPQLWIRGSWAGLLVAVGFTALLNVLLMASLVFREWLTLQTQLAGYAVLATAWLLARWQSRAERRASMAVEANSDTAEGSTDGSAQAVSVERDTLFREAQGHYLRNDWVATEQLLLKLLKQDGRDVESRLMLATLWRHQGRLAEAKRQLDRLARLEAARQWENEIAAERMALEVETPEVESSEAIQTEPEETSDAPPERPVGEEASNVRDDGHQRRAA